MSLFSVHPEGPDDLGVHPQGPDIYVQACGMQAFSKALRERHVIFWSSVFTKAQ